MDSFSIFRRSILLTFVQSVGIASLAFVGTVIAGDNGLDLFGCLLLACCSALGGAVFGDILSSSLPAGSVIHVEMLVLCIVTGVLTFARWPVLARKLGHTHRSKVLAWTETVGSAALATKEVYTFMQTHAGSTTQGLNATCYGFSRSTFGGIIRDTVLLTEAIACPSLTC